MRLIYVFVLLLSFSAVWGQSAPDRLFDQHMATLAAALASFGAEDAGFRHRIHTEVGSRFDGDYNALLSSFMDHRFPDGQTLTERINALEVGAQLLAFIQAEPRLQLAVPVAFTSWNPVDALAVCWVSAEYDEATSTEVACILPNGDSTSLSLQAAPAEPVWVLSINERTDVRGQLIPGQRNWTGGPIDDLDDRDDGDDGDGGGNGGGDGSDCFGPDGGWQYLESVYCSNLNAIEHWIAGAPEIQFIFKRIDNSSLINGEWGTIIEPPERSDIDQTWFQVDATLFRWFYEENGGNAATGFSCMVFVNERDNGDLINMPIELSLTTPGGTTLSVDFTVQITDKDEIVGSLPAYFIDCNHFTYNPGTVRFKMYRQ